MHLDGAPPARAIRSVLDFVQALARGRSWRDCDPMREDLANVVLSDEV